MTSIRFYRLRARLTQAELAGRAGMSQPSLARIESGRVTPRIDTVERLLRECGMSLEVVPQTGEGIDRGAIRQMLALTPAQRLQVATQESRNLALIAPKRRR